MAAFWPKHQKYPNFSIHLLIPFQFQEERGPHVWDLCSRTTGHLVLDHLYPTLLLFNVEIVTTLQIKKWREEIATSSIGSFHIKHLEYETRLLVSHGLCRLFVCAGFLFVVGKKEKSNERMNEAAEAVSLVFSGRVNNFEKNIWKFIFDLVRTNFNIDC